MGIAYRPLALFLASTLAACGGGGNAPSIDGGRGTPNGTAVTAALTTEQRAEVDRLKALQAETEGLTADQLLSSQAVAWKTLGYDPTTAQNLPLIQASALKLDAAELDLLRRNGFVISDKRRYPHFGYGYETIYAQDLPVFVSADSILQAVHQGYDHVLKMIEIEALLPELSSLVDGMRARLAASTGWDAATRADTDLFLAVAKGLLADAEAAPVAGADAALIHKLFQGAKAETGSQAIPLFGVQDRIIDFSQFKPRGHYTDSPDLARYFRAMMWLGRIDFPFIHTDATGKQILVRPAIAAAFALRSLMNDEALAGWKRLDQTIRAFVGEPDAMAPPDVDRLAAALGIQGTDIAAVEDGKLAQAIIAGNYGKQKILSQIVIQDAHEGAWPLDATFLFLGQRYTFDSHVLSNVVYDRVKAKRMMPNPLDAAYAALGNRQAAALLAPELKKYPYASALESMRRLGDEHGSAFWSANLYNLWQGALRSLSPGQDIVGGGGLPTVARTEAWGRRLLNTQLASWAQLRHDTILYAKQSYTTGVLCEFPDAYVDPYPAFFAKIEELASMGMIVVGNLSLPSTSPVPGYVTLSARLTKYFSNVARVAGILREMAELQRQGQPHKPEHLAFINQIVKNDRAVVCGGSPVLRGWYADLFWTPDGAANFDPTIADVHTQPTDENGSFVGHVLHVGTGYARLMVTTIDTCMGPRAYAGLAFSYHEHVTKDLERLNDADWSKKFTPTTSPDDVAWMKDLIAK